MSPNSFSTDVLEFLYLLDLNRVHYVIVGGEAVIYYGYVRLTGDIGIFYEPTTENADALFQSLLSFWGGDPLGIQSVDDLLVPCQIIQYGRPPNRIDLMNTITGVSFEEAWKERVLESVDHPKGLIMVPYIGVKALIQNKEHIGRDKDHEDLKYLRQRLSNES